MCMSKTSLLTQNIWLVLTWNSLLLYVRKLTEAGSWKWALNENCYWIISLSHVEKCGMDLSRLFQKRKKQWSWIFFFLILCTLTTLLICLWPLQWGQGHGCLNPAIHPMQQAHILPSLVYVSTIRTIVLALIYPKQDAWPIRKFVSTSCFSDN